MPFGLDHKLRYCGPIDSSYVFRVEIPATRQIITVYSLPSDLWHSVIQVSAHLRPMPEMAHRYTIHKPQVSKFRSQLWHVVTWAHSLTMENDNDFFHDLSLSPITPSLKINTPARKKKHVCAATVDHGGASLTFSKVQRAVQVLGSGSSLRLGHSCMIYKLIYYENNVYNIFIIQYYLVGGLEHEFYDFPYIGNNDPNWRTHIFQRGRSTTKQLYIIMVWFVFTHEFCLPRSTAFVQAIRLLDGAAFHLLEKNTAAIENGHWVRWFTYETFFSTANC